MRKKYKHNRATEVFFERGWRAQTLQALFSDLEFHLRHIPEDERWNLYFTVAEVAELPGRKLMRQDVLPFDIDDIAPGSEQAVLDVALETLDLDPLKTACIFSGHGVQFFAQTPLELTHVGQFDEYRPYYRALCAKVSQALQEHGLPGHMDPSVWSAARIMRLPETINRKEGMPDVRATLTQSNLEMQAWNLKEVSGVIDLVPKDFVKKELFAKLYPSPDKKAVLEGCSFLRYVKGTKNVSEPQWYAALGILSYLPESDALALEYSEASRRPDSTDQAILKKKDQAYASTQGPRTCSNIHDTVGYQDCVKCPHFGKTTTPLAIHGPDFIRTEKNGFHEVNISAKGTITVGRPMVSDLVKFWMRTHKHVSHKGHVWVYKSTFWQMLESNHDLLGFAQRHFEPKPSIMVRSEFAQMITTENLVTDDFWTRNHDGFLNLQNGVLDISTKQLLPHSPDYGFKYILPYDWNPGCSSPDFDKFLREITCNDPELEALLLDIMAYAISDCPPRAQKGFFLHGTGANGKSSYLDVLRALCGRENVSNLQLHMISNPNSARRLDGKLVNISEELSKLSEGAVNTFKIAVAGGEITAKYLYKDEYDFKNRAKFVIAGNEKPYTTDKNEGFLRRLVLIPFNAFFTEEQRDYNLVDRLTTNDSLSGILNLVVDHWVGLRQRDYRFAHAVAADAAKEEFALANDPVKLFFTEYMVSDPEARGLKKDIFSAFKYWCEDLENIKPPSAPIFWRGIDLLAKTETVKPHRGAREVVGIKLTDEAKGF